MLKYFLLTAMLCVGQVFNAVAEQLRMGVVGMSHGHIVWVLKTMGKQEEVKFVGFVESNRPFARQLCEKYNIDTALIYPSMQAMYDAQKPDAVCAFNAPSEHEAVVDFFAPKGVDVMVEKPLATNYKSALRMQEKAKKHGILLYTNYETSWYPSTYFVKEELAQNPEDAPFKFVMNYGHHGPAKLNLSKPFLEILNSPTRNGGGAVVDFGCYGANIMSWMMNGQAPLSVYAETRNYQQESYPEVDDDALIVLDYGTVQAVIQASWNWPINRKEMMVYRRDSEMHAVDALTVSERERRPRKTEQHTFEKNQMINPFSHFAAVRRKEITAEEFALYSTENNVLTCKILDMARKSAQEGRKILWEQDAKL